MTTTVLVVDDDDAHRGMLRMMLKSWGYTVEEAADGDEAVEKVHAKAFDAVLTDVRMGKVNGIEAMKQILLQPLAAGHPHDSLFLCGNGSGRPAHRRLRLPHQTAGL